MPSPCPTAPARQGIALGPTKYMGADDDRAAMVVSAPRAAAMIRASFRARLVGRLDPAAAAAFPVAQVRPHPTGGGVDTTTSRSGIRSSGGDHGGS
jgi:hypothetical protein